MTTSCGVKKGRNTKQETLQRNQMIDDSKDQLKVNNLYESDKTHVKSKKNLHHNRCLSKHPNARYFHGESDRYGLPEKLIELFTVVLQVFSLRKY